MRAGPRADPKASPLLESGGLSHASKVTATPPGGSRRGASTAAVTAMRRLAGRPRAIWMLRPWRHLFERVRNVSEEVCLPRASIRWAGIGFNIEPTLACRHKIGGVSQQCDGPCECRWLDGDQRQFGGGFRGTGLISPAIGVGQSGFML